MKFKPNGIVTLLTDFGLDDVYVPSMKGVMLSIDPRLKLIDLTHGVLPQNITQAGFLLKQSSQWFPEGTVHLAVVDPGVGSDRLAICVECEGSVFVAPDNGLLWPILQNKSYKAWAIHPENANTTGTMSSTFHGRDIFSPAAGLLATGRCRPDTLGHPIQSVVQPPFPSQGTDSAVAGSIIHIDRFGNLVTSLSEDMAKPFRPGTHLKIGDLVIDRFVDHYSQAEDGSLVFLIGSSNLLEVSVVKGSARDTLGTEIGAKVELLPRA